jgi:hypothetical protein
MTRVFAASLVAVVLVAPAAGRLSGAAPPRSLQPARPSGARLERRTVIRISRACGTTRP